MLKRPNARECLKLRSLIYFTVHTGYCIEPSVWTPWTSYRRNREHSRFSRSAWSSISQTVYRLEKGAYYELSFRGSRWQQSSGVGLTKQPQPGIQLYECTLFPIGCTAQGSRQYMPPELSSSCTVLLGVLHHCETPSLPAPVSSNLFDSSPGCEPNQARYAELTTGSRWRDGVFALAR